MRGVFDNDNFGNEGENAEAPLSYYSWIGRFEFRHVGRRESKVNSFCSTRGYLFSTPRPHIPTAKSNPKPERAYASSSP